MLLTHVLITSYMRFIHLYSYSHIFALVNWQVYFFVAYEQSHKKVAPFSIFVLKILNSFVILSNHSSYIYIQVYMVFYYL